MRRTAGIMHTLEYCWQAGGNLIRCLITCVTPLSVTSLTTGCDDVRATLKVWKHQTWGCPSGFRSLPIESQLEIWRPALYH